MDDGETVDFDIGGSSLASLQYKPPMYATLADEHRFGKDELPRLRLQLMDCPRDDMDIEDWLVLSATNGWYTHMPGCIWSEGRFRVLEGVFGVRIFGMAHGSFPIQCCECAAPLPPGGSTRACRQCIAVAATSLVVFFRRRCYENFFTELAGWLMPPTLPLYFWRKHKQLCRETDCHECVFPPFAFPVVRRRGRRDNDHDDGRINAEGITDRGRLMRMLHAVNISQLQADYGDISSAAASSSDEEAGRTDTDLDT